MEQNDPAIAPSMLYAYAALMENLPFANGAPNLTVDVPALQHLAEERKLPIGGKDFKTGQTMMKTVLAPAFKARMLGLAGWRSEEHTSELQSHSDLVCRLLLEKKKTKDIVLSSI